MASRSFKSARNSFERDLVAESKKKGPRTLGEGAPFNPQRFNSGNEQQSELMPSAPPAARTAPKSRPAAASPRKAAPLPPRRPPLLGGAPGLDQDRPTIPGSDGPIYPPPLTGPDADRMPALGTPLAGPGPDWAAADLGAVPALPPALPPAAGPVAGQAPMPVGPLAGPPGAGDVGPALTGSIGPTPGPQGLLDALSGYLKRMNPF